MAFGLQAGPDEGTTVELDLPADTPRVTELDPGDAVRMGRQPEAPEELRYSFLDPDRRATLVYLALLFAIVVVALGGLRGIAALAGLGATIVVLLAFILPIVEGRSPLAVSLVGAASIAFLALYVSPRVHDEDHGGVVGHARGLVCVAALAVLFLGLAALTAFGTEEAFIVQALGGTIDLRGLLLGGMIIGALGAIDDMTVTQASTVWELREADPGISRAALLRAGMRIGRDHVASTVNTLVLAYAGASMPLLVLFVLSEQSAGTVANGEVLAAEIIRTLVGSIGLVASVPITTWLAVAVPARRAASPNGRRPPTRPRRELAARRGERSRGWHAELPSPGGVRARRRLQSAPGVLRRRR